MSDVNQKRGKVLIIILIAFALIFISLIFFFLSFHIIKMDNKIKIIAKEQLSFSKTFVDFDKEQDIYLLEDLIEKNSEIRKLILEKRAKQEVKAWQSEAKTYSEAKTNLVSIATSEIAYFVDNNRWSGKFEEIGWTPDGGGNRYSYYLSCQEEIPSAIDGSHGCPWELQWWFIECSSGPECFHAAAVGNIDSDSTLDIWVIDRDKEPRNIVNDVEK